MDYIKNRVKQARENSNRARKKGKIEYDRKLIHEGYCDWRVSIRGSYGWIVVRVGTQDEMEPWAEMLMRNGIEARASRNRHGKVVNS